MDSEGKGREKIFKEVSDLFNTLISFLNDFRSTTAATTISKEEFSIHFLYAALEKFFELETSTFFDVTFDEGSQPTGESWLRMTNNQNKINILIKIAKSKVETLKEMDRCTHEINNTLEILIELAALCQVIKSQSEALEYAYVKQRVGKVI